jgi:hypothetical protein
VRLFLYFFIVWGEKPALRKKENKESQVILLGCKS